jgi:sulfate/thiosulfate transport system permease protein
MSRQSRNRSVLPGFGLTMGITLLYLSLLVLIPLGGLFATSATTSLREFYASVASEQAMASYRLSFGASLIAASINAVFGFLVAWVLVRYSFPGRKIVDAVVDLPFALPTAVSGIALATIYGSRGWIGRWLEAWGVQVVNARLGVVVALTFIGLPFVVRTLQPALEDLDPEVEEAAASLGADRWQAFWNVILPSVLPALLTGFALAFARALGEYGSVIFISSNIPLETEITPLVMMSKLNEFDFPGAAAIAVVMLIISFFVLLLINLLQWWSRRYA